MFRNRIDEYSRNLARFSALAVASALPLTAVAQPESPTRVAGIEELVVTAQKKVESLQDAPIAISAFSDEMLENIGAYNVADVGKYAPNVNISQTMGSSNNITVNIRGMETAEPSLSIDPKIGIYLDGVYMARNAGAVFDIVDLERIEILRGPQGTLWGKNTTGGAMNIITAKPKGTFGFKQLISAGNDGYRRYLTTLDTPAVANVSAKFSYMKKEYEGYATNINPASERHLGSEDVDAYRIALQWDVTDSLSISYGYDRTDSEAVPQPFQVTAVGPGASVNGILDISTLDFIDGAPLAELQRTVVPNRRRDTFNLDAQGKEYVDIAGHNLTVALELGNAEIKSITAYREYDSDFSEGSDFDDGAWQGLNLTTNQMVPTPLFHSVNVKSQQQFSQEFQLVGSALDDRLDYVVGVFYFEEDGREENPWDTTTYVPGLPYLLRGLPMGSWYTTESESTAVYGQLTYHLSDQWGVTLGGRYTKDSKEITVLAEDPRLPADHTASKDWRKFTPSLTVDYRWSEDVNLYVRAAVGYNAGLFNAGALNATDPTDFSVFDVPADEEETTAYEFGLKSTWFDNRLRLNGAAFYNDNENLQVTDFINGTRTTINSGASTTKGLELELVVMPVTDVLVDASYGYVTTRQQGPAAGADVGDGDGRGTGHLGVSYSIPVLESALMTARVDTTYSGKTYFLASSEFAKSESYWLLNARLTLSELAVGNGSLQIALWGKNLLDEEYRMHGTDFGVFEGFGFAGHVFGPPRGTGIDIVYEL